MISDIKSCRQTKYLTHRTQSIMQNVAQIPSNYDARIFLGQKI